MKSRHPWVFPAIVVMLILVITIPSLVVELRRHALDAQEPLSVAEIVRLIEEQAGAKDVVGGEQNPVEDASPVNGQSSDQEATASTPSLPDRLASPVTWEMAARYFPMSDIRKATLLETTALRASEVLFWSVGLNDAKRYLGVIVGDNHFDAGEWDAARRYFESVLQTPGGAIEKRIAAGRLAWLEPDPQRAAYLLKLSCVKNELGSLANAAALCRMTGSEALEEHYEERLRKASAQR